MCAKCEIYFPWMRLYTILGGRNEWYCFYTQKAKGELWCENWFYFLLVGSRDTKNLKNTLQILISSQQLGSRRCLQNRHMNSHTHFADAAVEHVPYLVIKRFISGFLAFEWFSYFSNLGIEDVKQRIYVNFIIEKLCNVVIILCLLDLNLRWHMVNWRWGQGSIHIHNANNNLSTWK